MFFVGEVAKRTIVTHCLGVTTWKFSADGDATRLRVTDVAFGCVSEKTKASLEKGWKVLLHDSLKPHVERSG